MKIHLRMHEIGSRPRVRIWTDAMAEVGQFNVVSWEDVESFKRLADKMSICEFVVHDCQSNSECDCPSLSFGEEIPRE